MMGISIWQLLIILVIVILLFGTKKLKGIGGDLGGAIKSFRKAVKDEAGAENADAAKLEQDKDGKVIDGETVNQDKEKV